MYAYIRMYMRAYTRKIFLSHATECKDGHFGEFCDDTCHCQSGSCDKTTGHCPSGCAVGWAGNNCQKGRIHYSALFLQQIHTQANDVVKRIIDQK